MIELRREHRFPGVALFLSLFVGVGAAVGVLHVAVAAIVGVCIALYGVVYWQRGTLALAAFLPFAGIPSLLLQQSGWPVLVKDIIFVGPIYFGFALASRTDDRRSALPVPRTVAVAAGFFVAVALLQGVHTALTAPLIALIGLHTYVFYMPLMVVAACAVSTPRVLWRAGRMLAALSFAPSVVAIVEAMFIYTGHQSVVYSVYGPLARAVTQDFAVVNVASDLAVYRVPSLFTFPAQFYGYVIGVLPVCLAIALSDTEARWRRLAGLASALLVVAGFASGIRSAYVWIPAEVVAMLVFTLRSRRGLAVVACVGVVGLLLTAGRVIGPVASFLTNLGGFYLFGTTGSEFARVVQSVGFWGAGLGQQTGAIRYVLSPGGIVGIGVEGWYAQQFYELGILGLMALALLFGTLLAGLVTTYRAVRARPEATLVAAAIVVVGTTVVNLIKGPYIGLDPLNVIFWLIVGAAFAVPKVLAKEGEP